MDFIFTAISFAPIILILLVITIRQVNQYERGVMFTFGKYSGTKMPGWRIVIPIFQTMKKVDIRVKAVDVPDQEAITKDNISIHINAVIYYKIKDAAKSIIQVENFYYATSQIAQTTMRNMVGEVELDTLLQNREELSRKIQKLIDSATDPWGIEVENVELKDVIIPDNMKRTIGKQAEAEREKRAVIIKAEGEKAAADNIVDAAKKLNQTPGALHLRTLQSVNDLSSDQSNTTIWMLPLEVLRAIEAVPELLKNRK